MTHGVSRRVILKLRRYDWSPRGSLILLFWFEPMCPSHTESYGPGLLFLGGVGFGFCSSSSNVFVKL